jgi:hypothetical protein
VDWIEEPEVPVTVMVYVPAGVPFGFTVVPPPVLLDPQPATRKINKRATVPSGTKAQTRRLRTTKRAKIERTGTTRVPGQKSMWKCLFAISGGRLAVREIVAITREAVELAETVKAPHDAPLGNPEQVKTYERAPISVTVYVAGEPAETVKEEGAALKEEGLPFETFSTVFPPSRLKPVSGGPNGATMM